MENPSDNYAARCLDEINSIITEDIEKDRSEMEKNCSSDSLTLESIMSSKDEKYTRCTEKLRQIGPFEILVTPSDSEALELEQQARKHGVKGISTSETAVTSSAKALKVSRGESMPKSLPVHCRKSGSGQRVYVNTSPYSNPSSLLGVIQEEDEEVGD